MVDLVRIRWRGERAGHARRASRPAGERSDGPRTLRASSISRGPRARPGSIYSAAVVLALTACSHPTAQPAGRAETDQPSERLE